jgi:MFS family permease
MIVLARFAPILVNRIGARAVLTIGPVIITSGYLLLAFLEPIQSYWSGLFPGLLVLGIGMGITVAPLTTCVITSVDPDHVGIASGINNAVARIAGLLAIAAFTVVLTAIYVASIERSLDAMRATPAERTAVAAQRDRLGGAHFANPELQRDSIKAFENGYRGIAIGCAILSALAALADAFGIEEGKLRTTS